MKKCKNCENILYKYEKGKLCNECVKIYCLGESYVVGNFMYENSKIARNQITALNLRIYSMFLKENKEILENLKKLEKESEELLNDEEAIKEYVEAKKSYQTLALDKNL